MDAVGSLIRAQSDGLLKGLRMQESKLFVGHEYLLAFVADAWLAAIAPSCDAICSTMTAQQDLLHAGGRLPPLVFIPTSRRRARNSAFLSVVEHEIVHVNQAILGAAPEPPKGSGVEELLDFFVKLAAAEYEANFIQLVQWPETFPVDLSVSLGHWCVLRGYSQALEQVMMLGIDMDFPAATSTGFLESLDSLLPDLLLRIGASEEVIAWFLPLLTSHVYTAMSNVLSHAPTAMEHSAFRAAGLWLRPRIEAETGIQLGSKR
ncbi:MAG: hypothetical protein RBU30_21170 [Polyangia bacterium]|nr:hypothetical protein [Polyangia bacterium]